MENFAIFRFGLLIVMALAVSGCGEEDEFATGKYEGVQVFGIAQISSPMTIDVKQNGNAVSGSITPPFQDKLENITNGRLDGSSIQFDRKEFSVTYRYVGVINRDGLNTTITGGFEPLGCSDPTSGELCQTDSNGSFTVTKQ